MRFSTALESLYPGDSCNIGILIYANRIYHEKPAAVLLLHLVSKLHTEYGRMNGSSNVVSYVVQQEIVYLEGAAWYRIAASASAIFAA